ncbi:hypothetical protein [Pedobacter nototheniae]|uniref:hypothetical protein n=1 Tax=Pedobacter nototheniae TaxID=2488994 RepID=UPI0029310F53|nr:hypothetical protein [Pedobacter nototheniae]
MEQILNWRKGLFDSNYQVYKDGLLKFSLSFSSWKNTAIATSKDGVYLLKTNGILASETRILNNKNEAVAVITYDLLGFKAKIVLNTGEQFNWSYQNSWLSRWSVNNHVDKQVIFSSSSGNGMISSNVDDDILLIAGLFAREYYTRMLILFIVILFILVIIR